MDANNQRYSIKNLLFTKAIPNYVIPVPTAGRKVYSCTDCGDKFILEKSYTYHVNRYSVKISYFCRHCNEVKIFYNRCNLLAHIRTHSFKSATINVSDLKLEPLPLSFFKHNLIPIFNSKQKKKNTVHHCSECLCILDNKNELESHTLRAEHFMKGTKMFSCPICLYELPSQCALKAHFRVHLLLAPFYCPQCGVFLPQKNGPFQFNHDCEGFRTIRAAMRVKCPAAECHLIQFSDYMKHLKTNHLKIVYKCPFCVVACFEAPLIEKHLNSHEIRGNPLIFFQCEMCPGRLVLESQIENHLGGHPMDQMYPCWACGKIFKEVNDLITHHARSHNLSEDIERAFNSIRLSKENIKEKGIYRVIKKCDLCSSSFTYKCKYSQIKSLPNDCPNKCTTASTSTATVETAACCDVVIERDHKIKCPLCDDKISQDWEEIKKHFKIKHHRTHQCLDLKCVLPKMNILKCMKYFKKISMNKQAKNRGVTNKNKRKRNQILATSSTRNKQKRNQILQVSMDENTSLITPSEFMCKKCGHNSESKELFDSHLLSHRDPCMAYQCMECGECFVVKPSFSKHLLIEHGISDIEDYIVQKGCYNENSLLKYQDNSITNEPLRENQCKICRDQFDNSSDLEKHFRVHGMAFLQKNNNK